MKKLLSCVLSISMLCSSMSGLTSYAETVDVGTVEFRHQNVVGSQTCYADDTAEKVITEIPDVIQGMRINQPVFRAYMDASTAGKVFVVNQQLKDGKVLKTEEVIATDAGVLEFRHVRNCEMIEILYNGDVVASIDTEKEYVNGVAITSAPMSYQIYQRDENNHATITIKGSVSDAEEVSIDIGGVAENAVIENGGFTYTKSLDVGLYDITVTSDKGEVARYEQVGVGDVWVAAGQSNMTDMGALADNFNPETSDPINDNMHIIYAEDCKWQKMSHPAGEGRFFKTGTRTSPVTSFAREIAAIDNVPVGIVQSSVGGTNVYQWVKGVRDSDANSGYLFDALKSCFDRMPSTDIKGILWYQGCNDAINENYAYNYKNLQQKVFDEMRAFFGEDTPIITTQLNDANQDSNSSQGYYDAWSYVKDVQRQNEELYDNVYVVGTGELELGDTIHNSAASNVKLGRKWAAVAKNVVYGDTEVSFRQPTIDTAMVTGDKEITLTFKNTDGLKAATGTKRIGITNSLTSIALGDLKKEFVVRKGGSKTMTASNSGKGTALTIASAEIVDGTKVVITTEEELSGVVAVDCMYGKRFAPTLVDSATNESVLSFYNVIAEYEGAVEVTAAEEIVAEDTADLNSITNTASDSSMYVSYWVSGGNNFVSQALMKFDLSSIDLSKIVSAKLAIYTTDIEKDRSGNFTISEITTDWDNTAVYGNPNYTDIVKNEIKKVNTNAAGMFPVGNYSAIDITDYIKAYTGTTIGIGVESDFASVTTLAGVNSDNPPMLIIQPGKAIELTYTANDEPCEGVEVRIEGMGATEYTASVFTTDENGKINLNLTEGEYKATTETRIGGYMASSNTFTVENGDVSKSYTLVINTATPAPTVAPTPVPDEITYTFGSAYNLVKDFNTSALSETAIGDTGFKVSTATSNWNNVVVRDSSSTNSGYYPYGSGLAENGYYLFLGSGGNSSVSANLVLPDTIGAGKYIKITYAKPKATNNGSSERSAANSENTITIGTEVIDLQNNCEFDKWYTTTIKAEGDISSMSFNLGKWSAVAISEIEVVKSADTMELTLEENEKYITSENQTVQIDARVYNSVTTLMGESGIIAKGSVDEGAEVEYSAGGYNGVSIDENGVLTITGAASAGTVTITAKYGGFEKSVSLLLKSLGNATAVEIFGDEVVTAGGSVQYAAIPLADGVVIPARDTAWSLSGAEGVSIDENGLLTAEENAAEGIVKIKATLTVSGIQTEEVSKELAVTVRNAQSEASPYTIKGVLLTNGATDITMATGIDGVIIEKTADTADSFMAVVKVFDEDSRLIAEKTISLSGLADGVQSVDSEMSFTKAAFAKAYIAEPASEEYPENAYGIVRVEKNGSKITRAVALSDKAATAQVIVAQYKDGGLVSTAIRNAALAEGVNVVEIDTAIADGADVKVFLWDSVSGMVPMSAAVSELSGAEAAEEGRVVSDEVITISSGEYTNVPLVADWITGAKSGLGMGAGIIAPQGAPYGVDPELVDVSTLNVSYTYDENYPMPTTDNALWYKTGAFLASSSGANNSIYARDGADWEQKALPIGNGYMGGMLFGLPDKDQIQINEETFWAAGYRGTQTAVNSNTVNKNMSEGINGYMSVGNIFVDFDMPKGVVVNNYYRDLNLDEAVAHVQYEYDGVKYNREYFASYPKEVLVFRYTADEGMSFDVKPVSMHPGRVTVNDGEITIIGKLKDSEPYSSGGNAAWNQESDLEYCTKIKVIADNGTITDGYNTVNVSGSTGVTIIVAAATDYDPDQFVLKADGSVDMTKTPYKSERGVQAAIDKATARMSGAAAMSYDELKAEHIADYKSQFDTVKFSLTADDEICQVPTDELQASYGSVVGTTATNGVTKVSYNQTAYENLNKHLEELHYNYARYMMISSSRSTTMPATLQGKWCQSVTEIWGSCYCININMEMNYWFAGGANLLDSGMSLVKWFNSQIPAGRITAKNMYRVTPKAYTFENGVMSFEASEDDRDDVFIMHTKQAIMGTTDMTGSTNIQSPGNTAWLMYNIWDLYQTTGDVALLENELYPIMRKAANFYTQYLYTNMRKTTTDTQKYPDGYYYTTWAGRSPEQGPTHEGIKYDLQLVAGMYDYTIKAAEILGVDADKVAAWKEIRNHLEIPVELGDDGQIKEWAEETTYNTDASGAALGDPVHRHISHLVGLYPGTLINRDTPELLEGAKIVLEKRGDDSTGWSCSNKFLLWARALEGDKALELFRFQLAKKTYSNLFDTHAPFQIDGNFGSAAGVMELLMQSHTGDIYILPALPTVWDSGEISGIKAKNGAEVSIKWADGKATEIKIIPAVDGNITIGYEKDNTFTLGGAKVDFGNDNEYTIENATAGAEYIFVSE